MSAAHLEGVSPEDRGQQGLEAQPYELSLEFSRARDAGDPFAFQFTEQEYQLRMEGGVFQSAPFPWNPRVLADLSELEKSEPDRSALQRLGDDLRTFLERLDWARHETALEEALALGREVHLSFRSAAAELYALPWELLTLRGSGQTLGELPGCSLRYEWPRPKEASRAVLPAQGGRLLFAWSAAGGLVPADAHGRALMEACARGDVPFEPSRDVLGHVSLQALAEALKAAHEPISVLHILCHGGRVGDTYGLLWNPAREGGKPELVDGARLRQVLAPYAGTLRMVVLSACRSGGGGALGSHLGSVAQELHRVGIPAVVASRLPLSVAGSTRLTQVLYGELLGGPCSLERALGEARRQLALEGRGLDWASLQLYARAGEGPDIRPLAIRPYRGLLAFEAKHRRFFFGREKLSRELLERVRDAAAGKKPRFQVVAGASGAGKSSVVMAGLVPLLSPEEWDVVVVRPGELAAEGGASEVKYPSLRGLSRRLRAMGGGELLTAGHGATGSEVLEEARRLRQARPGRRLLLVVDQLEEVFTQLASPEERAALMGVLWTLGTSNEWECIVVSTLRVDHFERCAEVALDERTRLDTVVYAEQHRVFVAHMEAQELAAAIERPAREVGLELEAGLVEQLCLDVGQEPGALPLLEYALDLLWERREGRRLTNRVYEELGGVTGALTRTADRLYEELSEPQRRQARRLLVKLVDFRDATSPQTRRRVRVEEVRPLEEQARKAFEEVLEKLVRGRLLVKGEDEAEGDSGTWVQFAHEALIRRWKAVQTWVKEDWEREQQLRELDAWAKAWEAQQGGGDRGASYLLTGDRLGYARRVSARFRGELSARSMRFIAESDAAEARRKKQLGAVVLSLAVLLLLAVVAAVMAAWQRQEAKRQRTSVLDATHVAHSKRLNEQDPTLAALVLREVMHPEKTPEWTQTAVDTLQSPLSTAVLKGHQAQINAVTFSRDGQWVVTASGDNTARVWRADGTGTLVVLRGHEKEVWSAAFSPNGQWVVTASGDNTARVWRADGTSTPLVLRGHEKEVWSAAFSPDGQWVVTASGDNTARVWRADGSGTPLVLRGHEKGVVSAAFSPDGQWVVTASADYTARVWRADGSGPPVVLRGHGREVRSAAFSPDGQFVVTASWDNTARVWRADGTGTPVVIRGKGEVKFVAFSPDGQWVVTASSDSTAQLWRADGTGTPMVLRGHEKEVVSAAFSPDGQWVVTASLDNTARVWRADRTSTPVVLRGKGGVTAVAFSPDGQWVVTASYDRTARVWRADGTAPPVVLRGHENWVETAAFSPDGQWVVTASGDDTARVWRADGTGTPVVLRGHELAVESAAFSPDGQWVVTASRDNTARVWRADGTGTPVVLRGHEQRVETASFSPDGQWVVTASRDNTARVWRADGTGTPVVLRGHERPVRSAAFSPDGQWVVTASMDNTARVWRADGTGTPVVLRGHELAVESAAFSPDGQWVVTASYDRTARVWRADGTLPPVVLRGHEQRVETASFSPDGQWVVTASGDDTARLWRADGTGTPVVLRGHEKGVASAAFSPNGKWVVTASADSTARIWTIGIPTLQALLRTAADTCLSRNQRQRYLTETPEQARSGYEECERAHGRKPEAIPSRQ
ncbi:CHAT domain-containing protein [Cystobacter ferrugineus]|uniref:Uncharacterized protein n=1 Tax=Cystobacter ferrugineus TaxID=83449 RepID=A0A1L9B7W3_9BACT|nr:CHAT domain-containing protein [Cystobacter ferrugineus]OJH38339.1 hypothetical protein BON30_24705 [Cystobacter ferrugineus]